MKLPRLYYGNQASKLKVARFPATECFVLWTRVPQRLQSRGCHSPTWVPSVNHFRTHGVGISLQGDEIFRYTSILLRLSNYESIPDLDIIPTGHVKIYVPSRRRILLLSFTTCSMPREYTRTAMIVKESINQLSLRHPGHPCLSTYR